jgi:hypothetical protein
MMMMIMMMTTTTLRKIKGKNNVFATKFEPVFSKSD